MDIPHAKGSKQLRNSRNAGVIFDLQRYSIHDGPGIRTLVFMKGCPLRCLWCDNPESQNLDNEIIYIETNCIKCGRCVVACRTGAISPSTLRITNKMCTNCWACSQICPADARRVAGRQVTVHQVLGEIEKDRLFYRASGGGVTVGGGEPTMQCEFVTSLLTECQRRNIHTAIETCGYARWSRLERILQHLDLVLFDIKSMDPEEHVRLTGVSNEPVLRNARRIASYAIPVIIRVPIIPGYTDSQSNIESIAKFATGLRTVTQIELLPYHQLGERKYEWLGREYPLRRVEPPTQEHMESLGEIIMQHGLSVRIRN